MDGMEGYYFNKMRIQSIIRATQSQNYDQPPVALSTSPKSENNDSAYFYGKRVWPGIPLKLYTLRSRV